jgi:hypothetical protein
VWVLPLAVELKVTVTSNVLHEMQAAYAPESALAGSHQTTGCLAGVEPELAAVAAVQNAVTFQAQGMASRLLTGSADKSAVCWQVSCLAGMFAGALWLGDSRRIYQELSSDDSGGRSERRR